MRNFFKVTLLIPAVCCLFSILSGCSRTEKVDIVRLDRVAYSRASLGEEMKNGVELWKMYCGKGTEPTDSFWQDYCNSQAVKVFSPDVESRIGGEVPKIEEALGKVKDGFAKKFPDLNFPTGIYALVSPYSQSVMLSDSIALIALNHYLGEDYEGYTGLPLEQRALKTERNIPLDLTEALLRVNNDYKGNEWTPLLNKMIYEGAIAVGVKEVNRVSDNEALGVTEETFNILRDNESEIWKSIVESGLLYNSSPKVADEFIKPYPAKRYPSRVGRYFGMRIAESAMNNGFKLSEILSPDFYMSADALAKSRYSPIK